MKPTFATTRLILRPARREDAANLLELDRDPEVRRFVDQPEEPTMPLMEAAIGRVLPRLARAVMQATGATAYNILQNNGAAAHQAVMHVHFHIIPKYSDGAGLAIAWQPSFLDRDEGARLAQQIAAMA